MAKQQQDDDIDPELLGRMAHISRSRNISMTNVKNMVLKVGLSQMGESNEYDKVVLGFQLINQRLDILLRPLYECQHLRVGDKFSVGFISLTHFLKADCTPDIYFLWEEEMIRVLVDIEELDPGIFRKIKRLLRDYKKMWRWYAEYKQQYLESKRNFPIGYNREIPTSLKIEMENKGKMRK